MKKRTATLLIISGVLALPLSLALLLLAAIIESVSPGSGDALGGVAAGLVFLSILYALVVIPLGVIARVSHSRNMSRIMRYATPNDWQAISDDAWKTYKRHNVTMIASPPATGSGYLLTIDYEDDITRMEGFDRLLYAMQFGDYLWSKALAHRRASGQTVQEDIHHARQQWERERLMLPS